MSQRHNRFVWYELMTGDTEAAAAFYREVVGWGTQDSGIPGMDYTMFTAGERPVGGLMALADTGGGADAPPSWIGYVAVDDPDAVVKRVTELGGSVHVGPQDIPEVGRFAIVADPQQAVFALIKLDGAPPPDQAPGTPGSTGWHELTADDWRAAFAFYSGLFGWQKTQAMDMGEMGTYQLFGLDGQAFGGVFNRPPELPANSWLYYFIVGDIDAAAERVISGGGNILNGPMEVPTGQWILQGADPQGAMFALVGSRG